MKRIQYAITIIMVLGLCFSLNQEFVNGSIDSSNLGSSLTTDDQYVKAFPGGENITFDDLASMDYVGTHYTGVEFSPGYRAWNSTGNANYPAESGDNVAYTREINNWFVFEMPIEKVGFFVSTAGGIYNYVATAYTNDSIAIEEISFEDNTPSQYIEFNSPMGRIHNISVSGSVGFNDWWVLDSISYLEFISPTPNMIDFEDLSNGVSLTTQYSGISFQTGFTIWDSTASAPYPPHSGNNVVYTFDSTPFIIFTIDVEFVSLYLTMSQDYDMQILAYSESGMLLDKEYVYGKSLHQYITLESPFGKIQNITFTGDSGFNTYWVMDDLCYIEHVPDFSQLLTFDELDNFTLFGDFYTGVTFAPTFYSYNSTHSPIYPPHTLYMVALSQEPVNNITFDNQVGYVSFYISAYLDFNVEVRAYNVDGILIQTVDVDANALNQFVELYSPVGMIHKISITGDSGFEPLWVFDTFYFEEDPETFEFSLDFESIPFDNLDIYPHVTFSPNFLTWVSSGSVYYPPVSGEQVIYCTEENPNITFEIPIMYTSFYISTDPTDYDIDVYAYSSGDELLFQVSVEPDTRNKIIEIFSESSEIHRITLNGTTGYESHWTIENLYYRADIYTYDFDADGLTYYEEMMYNTDHLDWDSDDDGFSDGEEIIAGTNPNDPFDYPIIVSEFRYLSLILFVPLVSFLGLLFRRRK